MNSRFYYGMVTVTLSSFMATASPAGFEGSPGSLPRALATSYAKMHDTTRLAYFLLHRSGSLKSSMHKTTSTRTVFKNKSHKNTNKKRNSQDLLSSQAVKNTILEFDNRGYNWLHIAAECATPKAAAFLISLNPDALTQENYHGDFPVFVALASGDLERFKLFFTETKNVESLRNDSGLTILAEAIEQEQEDIVNYIIGQCPSLLEICSDCGDSPLDDAIFKGNPNVVKMITDALPNTKNPSLEQKQKQASMALMSGNALFANNFYFGRSIGQYASESGDTEFHDVVLGDNPEVIERLYQESSDKNRIAHVNDSGWTPFMTACRYGKSESAKKLHAIDPSLHRKQNKCKDNPVHLFANRRSADTSFLNDLINLDPTYVTMPNERGLLPLHSAARFGSLDTIQKLLEVAPDTIKVGDSKGRLPAHYAALSGNVKKFQALTLEDYKILSAEDTSGDIPLFSAIRQHQTGFILATVKNNEMMSRFRNSKGNIPIHIAAEVGNLAMVLFFGSIDSESLVAKNNQGETALHIAAKHNRIDIVHHGLPYLGIEQIALTTNDGKTARVIAIEQGNHEVAQAIDDRLQEICREMIIDNQ